VNLILADEPLSQVNPIVIPIMNFMYRDLVTIERANIDENIIQGYILHESDSLVLIYSVFDFYLDGLRVLRKNDITSMTSTDTDKFHAKLLRDEGIYQKVDLSLNYDLRSWK
jgi:hypothetical protein